MHGASKKQSMGTSAKRKSRLQHETFKEVMASCMKILSRAVKEYLPGYFNIWLRSHDCVPMIA